MAAPPATSDGERRPMFLHPAVWLGFAGLLLAVPLVGFAMQASGRVLRWHDVHPALNALLNATSAGFLLAGRAAIKAGDTPRHRRRMIAAFTASCLFLVSYVTRFLMTGAHRYPGHGWDRTFYLGLLTSHTLLAVTLVPLVVRTLLLARSARFVKHRGIARITWPIWLYVSVTGVIVYLMLYVLAPRLHG